ncbi:MAG: FHA domain-containing protein [Gammaproteobacteria bacterium]|nr:FHA domain-containing protein [Gammaproteobacteria bacterium]
MLILDELKRQSEKYHNDQEQANQEESSLQHLRCMKTIAALQQIHEYLHQLIELVNELKPEIRVTIEVGALGQLPNLRQNEYRLYAESSHNKEIVRLVFTMQSDTSIEITNDESPEIQKHLDLCRKQGLIVSYVSRTPPRININGYVPGAIEFYSDFAESKIRVIIQNCDSVVEKHYLLNTDRISEDTLNQLGNYILRRSTKFLEILVVDTQAANGSSQSNPQLTLYPQTQEMEASRLKSLFTREQHLYLTYHNKIKDLGTQQTKFVIGRAPDCDLIINSDLASRHHAAIVYRNGKFVLIDQSTNGSFIKGQSGKEVYVRAEETPITGAGFISLGKSVTVDNENLIYYSCQ